MISCNGRSVSATFTKSPFNYLHFMISSLEPILTFFYVYELDNCFVFFCLRVEFLSFKIVTFTGACFRSLFFFSFVLLWISYFQLIFTSIFLMLWRLSLSVRILFFKFSLYLYHRLETANTFYQTLLVRFPSWRSFITIKISLAGVRFPFNGSKAC